MTTNEPVQVHGHVVNAEVKPEWLRVPDAIRISGVGRSTLYELIKEQRIKSIVLRKRNAIRGIRLINADSLSAFLESFV